MLSAAREVEQFVRARSYGDFESDLQLRRAVERSIEIIGEAARNVSRQTRDECAGIPWRPITAQRNRLAHEYDQIRHELIWMVATVHVPRLIRILEPLLHPPEDPLPEPDSGKA